MTINPSEEHIFVYWNAKNETEIISDLNRQSEKILIGKYFYFNKIFWILKAILKSWTLFKSHYNLKLFKKKCRFP